MESNTSPLDSSFQVRRSYTILLLSFSFLLFLLFYIRHLRQSGEVVLESLCEFHNIKYGVEEMFGEVDVDQFEGGLKL